MNEEPCSTEPSKPKRCAIYTRSATNRQGSPSHENQNRLCREAATGHGWIVEEDLTCHEAASSGTSLLKRDGFKALIEVVTNSPRPYDVLIVDDTTPMYRTLRDILKVVELLEGHGASLYLVSHRLDSRDANFRLIPL